jgi:hypothetical protein
MTTLPAIFHRSEFADKELPGLVAVNRDDTFHEIVSAIPGWDAILVAHDRARRAAPTEPAFSDRKAQRAAAGAVLDGLRADEAAHNFIAARDADDLRAAQARIADAAREEVSERATSWVKSNLTKIEDQLSVRVQDVFDQAVEATSHLAGIREAADLAIRPMDAQWWAKLPSLASRLAELDLLASKLRPAMHDERSAIGDDALRRDWPLVGLFADYTAVWPRWAMTSSLDVLDTQNRFIDRLPEESCPWANSDRTVQLRALAELKPVARVRLGNSYINYLDELAARAIPLRTRLNDAEVDAAQRRRRGM